MNSGLSKSIKRQVNKKAAAIKTQGVQDFIDFAQRQSFAKRFVFAMRIIFKRMNI